MSNILGLFILLLLIFGVAMAYKHRHLIARWLNDTSLTENDKKRKVRLQRIIEDAQEEIKEIEEREAERR